MVKRFHGLVMDFSNNNNYAWIAGADSKIWSNHVRGKVCTWHMCVESLSSSTHLNYNTTFYIVLNHKIGFWMDQMWKFGHKNPCTQESSPLSWICAGFSTWGEWRMFSAHDIHKFVAFLWKPFGFSLSKIDWLLFFADAMQNPGLQAAITEINQV